MGFCLFNNVAVARYAQRKYAEIERVAIMDWDVITATARRESSTPIRRSTFSRRTAVSVVSGNGNTRREKPATASSYTMNLPLRAATPAEQKRGFEAALRDVGEFQAGPDHHLRRLRLAHSGSVGPVAAQDDDFVDMTRSVKQWAEAAVRDGWFPVWKAATTSKPRRDGARHVRELANLQ